MRVVGTSVITIIAFVCVTICPSAGNDDLLTLLNPLLAQTFEQARTKTKQGYGAELHGKIKINDKSFNFVSGGRGRGSVPFGIYQVGPLGGFKAPKGTWIPGYRLSDAYDPFVKDTRTGLFIHPGYNVSAGCIAIRRGEWLSFVKAIEEVAKAGGTLAIHLGPESKPMEKPVG